MVKLTAAFFDDAFRQTPQKAPQRGADPKTVQREDLPAFAAGVPAGSILRVLAGNRHIATGIRSEIVEVCPDINPIDQYVIRDDRISAMLDGGAVVLLLSYDADVPKELSGALLARTVSVRVP
jgi:hypothetical protein